jgi:hypothetical protein
MPEGLERSRAQIGNTGTFAEKQDGTVAPAGGNTCAPRCVRLDLRPPRSRDGYSGPSISPDRLASIGDMGSSLSGGQKQRVLLARALYRQPRILFLDEGTAHLDVENEKQINDSLRHLSMTRVSVAHRPEMSSGADRIIRLGEVLTIERAASLN